jgi:uroporphyrinogen decarboxylase
MNTREKYLACMSFDKSLAIPKWEYGYWAETVRNWYQEGLEVENQIPETLGAGESVRAEVMGYKSGGFVDHEIHQIFNQDTHQRRIPVDNFIYPRFEEEILEDHPTWIVIRDEWGLVKHRKKDRSTLEKFESGPVQTMADWETLKEERLQAGTPGRFPENWNDLVKEYKERDYPLVIGGGQGFFGSVRYLMGEIQSLVGFAKSPDLIHAINDHLCNFWIELYDKALQAVKPDTALIWEDMCYKSGPLISPKMVEEYMMPYYKRLCGFFKESGVTMVHVDTDGDAWQLIPLFIEAGVTGVFPMEVIANMNVMELREAFPKLQMLGGVDKMCLMKDKKAIDEELENKILPVMKTGGFIPTVDHLVPPGISWENFSYFRSKLNQMIDAL